MTSLRGVRRTTKQFTGGKKMKKIGTLILALGLIIGFAGCKHEPDNPVLSSIEIREQPTKTTYMVGETLDTTGMKVYAIYDTGSEALVYDWVTNGFNSAKAAENQEVIVRYTENYVTKTATFKVTIKAPPVTLSEISVTAQPTKKEYVVGDTFDKTGLKVTAKYSDTTTKDVTAEVTTSGFDSSKPVESQTITVTYGGKSATFTVKILAVKVTKIEITTEPTKKEYFVGETTLDTTGMVVTATYNNGTTADVTKDVTTIGFDSRAAKKSQTIIITYGGWSATFTVKILAVEVTKIEITTEPTRKVYYMGSPALDLTGMVVTETYNNGTTVDVTKEVTTSGFDSSAATESQTITVTYGGNSATFTISILFSWCETPMQLPAGTDGTYGTEGTYFYFGVWPQDVVPVADVAGLALDENATTTIERGCFKFVKGTDGNYYVKCSENAYASGYKYNKDNSDVGQGGTTYRWFKVMPIKWRVFDEAYDVDGDTGSATGKLLVAENILTANVPYCECDLIHRNETYPNNYKHSQIRAYLNGISYNAASETDEGKWLDKGFFQTAFGETAQQAIITTKVDNSKEQMSYDGTGGMDEKYACDPTDDKIFLLSEYEVRKYSKRTDEYYSYGTENSRIRFTTDFAKANYAYQSTTDGYGCSWWLRSPHSGDWFNAHFVGSDGGAASYNYYGFTTYTVYGVVPAMSISF